MQPDGISAAVQDTSKESLERPQLASFCFLASPFGRQKHFCTAKVFSGWQASITAPETSTWQPKDGGPAVPVVVLNGISEGEARADGEDSSWATASSKAAGRRRRHTPAMFLALEKQLERVLIARARKTSIAQAIIPVSLPREASAKEADSPTFPRDHSANFASDKARTLVNLLSILFQDYWNTSVHTISLLAAPKLLSQLAQGVRHSIYQLQQSFPSAVAPIDVFQDSWNRPAPLSPDDWDEPARPPAK
ncbi:hypothetical protein EIP91_001815 [Steccherinum ochraceum]|uniref:Uncharacterized protein n=1 Tax=Steccherinum ochraceum TaxID=92696 RepID=A0A4R0S2S9_9APHY|nr:hypothetical protein EIP91_001815 [Steccherinum ochraceum]